MSTDKKAEIIPAGSLLTITTGAYSDYTVHGVFRALVNIDSEALRIQWFTEHPEQTERYSERLYLGWIARKGLIEPVDCFEWYLNGATQNIEPLTDRYHYVR